MNKDDEPQLIESTASEISWHGDTSCKGTVQILPSGVFHFVLEQGQSLDGCPAEGADLHVSSFFGSRDRYRIFRFEPCMFDNARNFRAIKIREAEEPMA
jgi:hypothetical protein